MSQCVVSGAKDFSGLKQAALELMEEARSAPERERIEKLAQMSADPGEILRACGGKRSLAEGYYARVGYLMELQSFLSMGVQLSFALDVPELRGMQSIAGARAEFDRAHPPCKGSGGRVRHDLDKTLHHFQ